MRPINYDPINQSHDAVKKETVAGMDLARASGYWRMRIGISYSSSRVAVE